MTSSNGNIFRVTGPLCGEFTGPGEFPTQRPATRSFDVFFDLRLNRQLSKQPWDWWFETPSWSLWRQCNEKGANQLKKPVHIQVQDTCYSDDSISYSIQEEYVVVVFLLDNVGATFIKKSLNSLLMTSLSVFIVEPSNSNCSPNFAAVKNHMFLHSF